MVSETDAVWGRQGSLPDVREILKGCKCFLKQFEKNALFLAIFPQAFKARVKFSRV